MRIPHFLGRPYAHAVFDMAKASGTLEVWHKNLQVLGALAEQTWLMSAWSRKKPQEVKDLVLKITEGLLTPEGKSFAILLVEQKRLAAAGRIAEIFQNMWIEDRGVGVLDLTSAKPLDEAQKKDLVAAMEKAFGQQLEARFHLDSYIQGGFIARVGDRVLDSSVKGKLEALARHLKP